MQHGSLPLTRKKMSLIFLILVLIFFIPFLLAYCMIHYHYQFGDKATNKGYLINPPLDFSRLSVQQNRRTIAESAAKGKWLLVYLNPQNNCDKNCQQKLYEMRQIQRALGKDQGRVNRLLLTFNQQSDSRLAQLLQQQYLGTWHWQTTRVSFSVLVAHLPAPAVQTAMTQGYWYIVDPLGNLILSYPLTASAGDLYKDLQHLLRASQIG